MLRIITALCKSEVVAVLRLVYAPRFAKCKLVAYFAAGGAAYTAIAGINCVELGIVETNKKRLTSRLGIEPHAKDATVTGIL